MPMKNSQVAAI